MSKNETPAAAAPQPGDQPTTHATEDIDQAAGHACGGCAGCGSDCSDDAPGLDQRHEAHESAADDQPADEGDQQERGDDGSSLLCVRYGRMGQLALFRSKLGRVPYHSRVVIKSDRGMEIGTVLCPGNKQMTYEDRPLRVMGAVRRLATHDDLMEDRHLQQSAMRERKFCEERIRSRKLPMKLAEVEHLFGGDRIIFYFLSDGRVDFRDLVRDLAQEYQTRIEMRQIGVRDEARLMADYERCGQYICCRAFIKEFKPVTMRMAKVQKATLDPTKISGRCGRLMCCLRYENETYNDLKERLPRRNSYVRTADGVGKVIGGDIMTQLVKVSLLDKTHVIPVDQILQRNVPEAEYFAQQQEMLEARQRKFSGRGGPRPDRQRRERTPDSAAAAGDAARQATPVSVAEPPAAQSADDADAQTFNQQDTAADIDRIAQPPAADQAADGAPGRDSASRRRRQRRKRRKQAETTGMGGADAAQAAAADTGAGDAGPASDNAGNEGAPQAEGGNRLHHRPSRRERERHGRRGSPQGDSGLAGMGDNRGKRDNAVPRAVLERYGMDAEFIDAGEDDDRGNRQQDERQSGQAGADRQKRRRRRRRKPRTGGGQAGGTGQSTGGSGAENQG
jgi:cell fate regulator YaaT (PSP1 superfamily)